MAPGRKRGANKLKSAKELSLGDLVLAKVKGFPAWPAKVSKPEDWGRSADPKKYFVQFFGTLEIAFVAPADIQAFTSEFRSKLLTRCKGKTVKYFSQAVKEICDAFDELQGNNLIEDTKADGMEVDALDPKLRKEGEAKSLTAISGVGNGRFQREGGSSRKDRTSDNDINLSPTLEPDEKKRASNNLKPGEEEGILTDSKDTDYKTACYERDQSTKGSSTSPYSGMSDVKPDSVHGLMGGKKINKKTLGAPARAKFLGERPKALMNREKSSDSDIVSKRKLDGSLKGSMQGQYGRKTVISGRTAGSPVDDMKSESIVSGKKGQKLLAEKNHVVINRKSHEDAVIRESANGAQANHSIAGLDKRGFSSKDRADPSKKAKQVGFSDDALLASILKNGEKVLQLSNAAHGRSGKVIKESVDSKTEDSSKLKPREGALGHYMSGDEDGLPPAKRQRQVIEATTGPNVSLHGDKKSSVPVSHKSESKKRRAIRLCDDEEDEKPKTPVHGGSSHKLDSLASASAGHSVKTSNGIQRSTGRAQTFKGLAGSGEGELVLSTKSVALAQSADQSNASQVMISPRLPKSEKQPCDESVAQSTPAKKSSQTCAASSKVVEETKADRHGAGVSVAGGQVTFNKCSSVATDALGLYQSHSSTKKDRQPSGGDKLKGTPKMVSHVNEAGLGENHKKIGVMLGGRPEDLSTDKASLSADSKATDSTSSIKHLIAAAQAKRRQAQMQFFPQGNSTFFTPSTDIHGRSPSPFLTGAGSAIELELRETCARSSSLPTPGRSLPIALQTQVGAEEHDDDKRATSGHVAIGDSLSGGTEAAVARDAFEGMIETLSRTKESIGRATRLAVDCAKYGIANEVVDLLVRKLESEPSFHRRVDLFFLVDSITQCSYSHKGVAESSYIPAVQATLARILGAAAPAGGSARENRRQCLKVLRLWLERKILPESILRHHIESIEEMSRHPSRTERAVDDPIRGMEGMLVDEYGSNATFQLPGFLCSHAFVDDEEDEEDAPSTSGKGADDASPMETLHRETNSNVDTPNDRHPHILEDVDGELEMEDVSGHQKEHGAPPLSGATEIVMQDLSPSREMDPIDCGDDETVSLDGSPPLPLEPPPALPPLPSSPPPPPPPLLSPSPPPPPPSQLPLPSQPPPPPPPPLHSGPPLPGHVVPSLPGQQSFSPQVLTQPASGLHPSQVTYQPPVSLEYCSGANGNQLAVQQSPCLRPAGLRDSSSRPLEYGHGEVYVNAHASQSNHQLQSGHPQFGSVSFNHNPPQPQAAHYPYNKPAVRQNFQQPYPRPFSSSSPSLADGRTRFADEQWRATSGEFKADNQHGTWINGVRAPAVITKFGGEGYYHPPERAPANMGFQFSASNPLPSAAPPPGHANQIFPSRPDMSALNCWRPA